MAAFAHPAMSGCRPVSSAQLGRAGCAALWGPRLVTGPWPRTAPPSSRARRVQGPRKVQVPRASAQGEGDASAEAPQQQQQQQQQQRMRRGPRQPERGDATSRRALLALASACAVAGPALVSGVASAASEAEVEAALPAGAEADVEAVLETLNAPADIQVPVQASEAAPADASPAQSCLPEAPSSSPALGAFQLQSDAINACAYLYPVALPAPQGAASPGAPAAADGPPAQWVLTRAPERYSSAAPLSPDARLRIVSERIFVRRGVTLSVAISPPNASFLSLPPPPAAGAQGAPAWTALAVARSVLADRTSPRMTSAQRLQETVIGAVGSVDVCGVRYYSYEYLNSRSPTALNVLGPKGSPVSEVFRHSLAVTAEREGFLYTLTASCLDTDWAELEGAVRAVVGSFRLTPTTRDYVAPWRDPWRFW